MAKFLVVAASSGIGQTVTAQLKTAGNTVLTTARSTDKIKPDFILDAADFAATDAVFEKCGGLSMVRPKARA